MLGVYTEVSVCREKGGNVGGNASDRKGRPEREPKPGKKLHIIIFQVEIFFLVHMIHKRRRKSHQDIKMPD